MAELSGLSSWPVDQAGVLTERESVAPVPFALAVEAHARGTTPIHKSEPHVAVALLYVLHRLACTNSDSFSMNPQTTDHVCQFADMRGRPRDARKKRAEKPWHFASNARAFALMKYLSTS